jgi:hypothetical protein
VADARPRIEIVAARDGASEIGGNDGALADMLLAVKHAVIRHRAIEIEQLSIGLWRYWTGR